MAPVPPSARPISRTQLPKLLATGARRPHSSFSSAFLVFPGVARPTRYLLQARGLGTPRLPEVLVYFVAVTHLGPGITDQLPTDQPGIATVHRVAEHAFDRVSAQELEEMGTFELSQLFVLFFDR